MHEVVEVAPSELLLDMNNARLTEPQETQPATYIALAKDSPTALMGLCENIIERGGLDPSALLVIVATGDSPQQYVVLEGNRRVLALKVLETPALLVGKNVLSAAQEKKLNELAARFAADPVASISCVLYEPEEEAWPFIEIKHTGANDGAGTREWGSLEKERHRLRHGRVKGPSPQLQVVDFLQKIGAVTFTGQTPKISTTLGRLFSNPEVRAAYGLDADGGDLVAMYPAEVIAPALTELVDDLVAKRLKVGEVYDATQRRAFAKKIAKSNKLDPAKRLAQPVTLDSLARGKPATRTKPKKKAAKKVSDEPRQTLIPRTCTIAPASPRLDKLATELRQLNLNTFPNLASVGLRVFLELSIDHEIERLSLLTPDERLKLPLAKKLKELAQRLEADGTIDAQLRRAVVQIADSPTLGASTVTLNQYVHNHKVHPIPGDLRHAWDQLQEFLEVIS